VAPLGRFDSRNRRGAVVRLLTQRWRRDGHTVYLSHGYFAENVTYTAHGLATDTLNLQALPHAFST